MAGHPIHPAVVHFPFALLLTSTLADLAHLAGFWREPRFAAWLMAWGLAAGLVAMAAGLYDFRRLTGSQVPHALRHMELPKRYRALVRQRHEKLMKARAARRRQLLKEYRRKHKRRHPRARK